LGIILIATEDKCLGSQEVDMIRREDFQVLQDTEGFYGHRPPFLLWAPGRSTTIIDCPTHASSLKIGETSHIPFGVITS
jgi:hypothetical protein